MSRHQLEGLDCLILSPLNRMSRAEKSAPLFINVYHEH